MSKVTLPFQVPQSEFVPAEFVTSSEVDGVPPKYSRDDCGCGDTVNCGDCREHLEQFRQNAKAVRAQWRRDKQRKMREMGIQE